MKKLFVLLFAVLIYNLTFSNENCYSQWLPEVLLTGSITAHTSGNNAWCVAGSGNVVHTVWSNMGIPYYDIYYKRSTNAGAVWASEVRLNNISAGSGSPSITVSGSVVHVVWADQRDGNSEIYYIRSTDAGFTWGADKRLTNDSNSWYPSAAVFGSVVHVVWAYHRAGNWEIHYKHSTDAGVSWGSDSHLNYSTNSSRPPSIAVSGSVVHVVWSGNEHQLYYKRSTDAGVSWDPDTSVTNFTASPSHPSVAVSGSAVHIIWQDERDGNSEIYYKRSIDAGVSWGADTRLTNNSAASGSSSLAVSGSFVNIVWIDGRDGYSNNDETYYKCSTNAGENWGADTRLSNNNYWTTNPSVAVSGSVVHVVWDDQNIFGNYVIFYKRNPTGNPSGIVNINSEVPSSYSLQQNYPNPFNPATKIKFDIPLRSPIKTFGDDRVVLKVYDVMGREVATLVNESFQPGTYEVSFDGSSLNSGVYFYKITAGDFTETKRMLLIK